MYSAHVWFTERPGNPPPKKTSVAIQIPKQNELVISDALNSKMCPCWWVHYHNSNRMWGEYKQANLPPLLLFVLILL